MTNSNSSNPEHNWYSSDSGYSAEQRKQWYAEAAEAYDRTRPRYPQKLIDLAVELADLSTDAQILEVGCGPGTATVPFAQLGYNMTCLEPSTATCAISRRNCTAFSNVEIINTTFEEWELGDQKFEAVLSATAWHWVSIAVKYAKVDAALRDRGSLILLWNTAPQPSYEVCQLLRSVYETHAPNLGIYEDKATQAHNLGKFRQEVLDSGVFRDVVAEEMEKEIRYSIPDYLALLSTLSPYIALEADKRTRLFADLSLTLERQGISSLATSHLSILQVAQKL